MNHTRVILKTDNEVSLVALVQERLKTMRYKSENLEVMTSEKSHQYDSQSNGATEVAIRELRAQLRTMKSALEGRYIKENIPYFLNVSLFSDVCLNSFLLRLIYFGVSLSM